MIANKDAGSATINNNLNAGEHLLAAAEAGALTAVMTNPLWVIKTRMCLQDPRDRPYTGLKSSLSLRFCFITATHCN